MFNKIRNWCKEHEYGILKGASIGIASIGSGLLGYQIFKTGCACGKYEQAVEDSKALQEFVDGVVEDIKNVATEST